MDVLPRWRKSSRGTMVQRLAGALCLCWAAFLIAPQNSQAWVFHEHTEIGRAALSTLSAEEKAITSQLWAAVRQASQAGLLCAHWNKDPSDVDRCVDLPMLAAIAADHSCSPADLVRVLQAKGFIVDVIEVAERAEHAIKRAPTPEARREAWIAGHTLLQGVDGQYLSRAEVTGAHFLGPRAPHWSLADYVAHITQPGAQVTGLALYILYHVAAMRLAADVGDDYGVADPKAALKVLTALMAETFAQHFLEDAFASGHVTGSWGSASQRMGTHDYYCEHGLEVRPWDTSEFGPYIAHGDAHMRPSDAARAATALRDSWRQFLGSFKVTPNFALSSDDADALVDHNSCKASTIPAIVQRAADGEGAPLMQLLAQTPQPVVDDQDAAPPRFQKEEGAFVAVFAGAGLDFAFDGYGNPGSAGTVSGTQSIGVGLGYDATGVLSRAYDSAFWLQGRVVAMGQQARLDCPFECDQVIERRIGFEARLRAPWVYFPGDGLFMFIPLLFETPWAIEWGLDAAGGGLGGIQSLSGPFQFTLGREVAVRFLLRGKLGDHNDDPDLARGVGAVQVDLPLVDMRLFRTFSESLAQGLLLQAGVGLDLNRVSTAYRVFITAGFDSRYYLGGVAGD